MREELSLFAQQSPRTQNWLQRNGVKESLGKSGVLNQVSLTSEEVPHSVPFLADKDQFYLVINTTINVGEEKIRLQKEIEYFKQFIASVELKLSNDKFAKGAPEAIVNKERQKLADGQSKLNILMEALSKMG
jgi:valyl-tRNA synthetase